MAWAPWFTASVASSAVKTPLITMGSAVIVRSQSTSAQVAGAPSRYSFWLGGSAARLPLRQGSSSSVRKLRSLRPHRGASTVNTIARHPDASARRTIAADRPRSRKRYNWNQTGQAAAAVISSIARLDEVLATRIEFVAEAAAAAAISASGQTKACCPVGAIMIGAEMD